MRAVGTNVLARYYLRDDLGQGRIAEGVLAAGDVFVPRTVILELEWLLRYVADQPESKVLQCIAHLIALPGITIENRDAIETALGYCQSGVDISDALHLAASRECVELLTFDDRGFARRATRLRRKPPVRVPRR